jgi:hypothetical protein
MNTLDKDYNNNATVVKYGDLNCYVIKIVYGETAGYHKISLTYNDDLILKSGEAFTSALDKLV